LSIGRAALYYELESPASGASEESGMFKRFAIPAATFVLLACLPAAGSAATIAQILGSPSSYDRQHVDVRGTVEHLEQKVSHRGSPYVTFSLCSGQCLHVFGFGTPNISDGRTVTVHGTYESVKHVSGYTFYNEIDADDGSL
jgi:hypothetical protein